MKKRVHIDSKKMDIAQAAMRLFAAKGIDGYVNQQGTFIDRYHKMIDHLLSALICGAYYSIVY
ncbi:hypothetical protein [Paenibacillus taiwanensis]|uniref:hypothetical protein n=1 Tax=Paenibacillus taiwanensis TaxID=401638 RepID=UPI000405A0D8|nr:hypothetical protein [Paenibacillus taiwanensis]